VEADGVRFFSAKGCKASMLRERENMADAMPFLIII